MAGTRLTAAQCAQVRAMWPDHEVGAIARKLRVGDGRVRAAARAMMLPPKRRRVSWTEAEDLILRARYRIDGGRAVARQLNRSESAVRQRWSDLVNGDANTARRPRVQPAAQHGDLPQAVRRDRCPMCNAPPLDPACGHGWDGETTRAMRRMATDLAAAARANFAPRRSQAGAP